MAEIWTRTSKPRSQVLNVTEFTSVVRLLQGYLGYKKKKLMYTSFLEYFFPTQELFLHFSLPTHEKDPPNFSTKHRNTDEKLTSYLSLSVMI